MVRCHLSTLMGQRKLRVADVARMTGLNRSTVTALCQQRATRVDLPSLDRLCVLLHCQVGDLFEHVADDVGSTS
jgi:putative transcriptional regulator